MPPEPPRALSEAKRRLLERYRSGKISPQVTTSAIPRRTSGNVAPQSFNQEQVWTHGRMMGDKPAYNELITIHRHGTLDVAVLTRVLDELNRRHEIWRTTFDMGEERPIQIIHDKAPTVKLRVFDLRKAPLAERPAESARFAEADAMAPFDVRKLPLWRAVLMRLQDDEYQLHLNLHQLILDGVTVYRILLPELISLYEAFSQGKPSPLPDPGPQYADFSIWQRKKLTPDSLAPHLAWWKQELAGAPQGLQWPYRKPRPPVQTYRGATEMLFLPAAVTGPLRAFAERESATLFMGLVAGFFTLMHRYTGQTDLILGMPSASRTPETEQIMGYFLNLLPVRVNLAGEPPFREVLARVRSRVIAAIEHGNVPLLALLREIQPPHDASRNPLFQVVISLEPPMPTIDPAWDLTQSAVSSGSTKMDMYLNLDTRPDGLMAPIMYNPDLFDGPDVERMFNAWKAILESGVSHPDQPISSLPLARHTSAPAKSSGTNVLVRMLRRVTGTR